MADPNSRYASSKRLVYRDRDGRPVSYLQPRRCPQGSEIPAQGYVAVTAADVMRLDLVAARALKQPLQFWRLADANDAMNPLGLVAAPGRTLKIPQPGSTS